VSTMDVESFSKSKTMELPRNVVVGHDALLQVGEVCHSLKLGRRALIVADETTMKIAGKTVETQLGTRKVKAQTYLIPDATWEEVRGAEERIRKGEIDFALGVGGGRSIDVAKCASFNAGVPFLSVPTAASHDGVVSSRASIMKKGEKVSFGATVGPRCRGARTFAVSSYSAPKGWTVRITPRILRVRPGATGDITLAEGADSNDFVAWHNPQASAYTSSPLFYRDRIYVVNDNGILTVLDGRTGDRLYRARVGGGGFTFSSSPWAYGGRVFFLSEDGETFVAREGAAYEEVGRNPLEEMTLASPAIAGDSLYLRTQTKLYRLTSGSS